MKSNQNYDMSKAPTMSAPRASFKRSHSYSTTIDFDYIYPVYYDEIYPGDSFKLNPQIFARLATPIHPIMDNMFLDIFFFFCPLRLAWDNSFKFFGQQDDPGDSIDFTIPQIAAPVAPGYTEGSRADYWGLPTKIPDYEHSAIYDRAYCLMWNRWFRDENLQDQVEVSDNDGPDTTTNLELLKRGKRHDYFTSGLLSPQKSLGGAVSLPLGTTAPVFGIGTENQTYRTTAKQAYETGKSTTTTYTNGFKASTSASVDDGFMVQEDANNPGWPNIYADLSTATAATIFELRQAMAIQSLLELDARAGTRYNEIVYSVFGVQFVDLSIHPEFLSGGSTQINTSQIPQTSNDGTNGSVGQLGAYGTAFLDNGGFTKSFTEHGVIIGVVSARADLTYTQGLDKLFTRQTRYDFLYPIMQNIGDDAILVKELYCQDPATDTGATGTPDNERVFAYQERYAELKYKPSRKTGLFRPNATQSLESWHLSEEFGSLPSFDETFIEQNTPVDRAIVTATEPHLILDMFINLQCARPMTMYSIPGMGQRF